MTKVVAIRSNSLDGGMWPHQTGVAVGGYPYYAAAPGPCSVHPNRGVEEEQG
jgi:hypothetical protein